MNGFKDINKYYSAIGKVLSSGKKKNALHTLKNTLEYKVLCQLTDGLTNTIKPLKFTIYGNPLPKSIEELGKSDLLFKPENLDSEINWLLLSVRKYSRELSIFLLQKREFERNFLLGNYKKAEIILGSILKEFGYSLWYIESKFLLLEYQNKSEEQKEFLSEINESNKKGMVGTIAHFLSYRTERNLSAYKYDLDIDGIFRINKNKFENDTREYYLFRLNFFENYSLSDYSAIVLFENCNSIIDRYLLLRDILKVLSLSDAYKELAYTKARYIYRKTKDDYLFPLLYQFNSETNISVYFDEKYVNILDLYCTGLYEEVINECMAYLIAKPSNFEILLIFVKSHVNLKRSLKKLTDDNNSLLNQLSQKIFDLMSSSNIRKDLLYNLYQINKNILSFDLAPALDYYLKKEQNLTANKHLKLLSVNCFDPVFTSVYSNDNDSKTYLDSAHEFFPNSIALKHRINYLNNELTEEVEISAELYSLDKAKILYNQKRYSDSISEWSVIIKKFNDNTPIIQTAIKYWFDCLLALNEFNSAIQLYVENHLINPNSVSKVNSTQLLNILRKERYKGIKRSIDLPIFVSLNSSDDTEKSFILEQYCKIFSRTRPSELFDEKLNTDKQKVQLFYASVCSAETLKHSIYINTTTERLSERLEIVNHLIEQFPDNKKYYQEELNLITNELIVYEGTQKLEESKIYANDQAIINYELSEIEGLYQRYRTIYKLSLKDKKIFLIAENTFAFLRYDGKEKYNETEVKYTDSALLEVFHELFDSILDKYLYSKFGIVAYLSTRIRHGVLLGEIRPEIEKQNLILNRIGNSSAYEESKFWSLRRFNLDIEKKARLHQILSKFSFKIDTLIEEIIKDKIQIRKDGKNEKGLFNYEFDKTELYNYALELATETDVKAFSQKVIDLIWVRTDANLEVIREYINEDVKSRFSDELNNLDKELRTQITNNHLPHIFTNLIECTTVIENKIGKISAWFRRSGSSINDFDIQRVFNIVWSNTEKCYPKIFAECNISISVNPTIKSNYYIHFTDLFRIMLDNMFKYGEAKNGKKNFKFTCFDRNGITIFSFTNHIRSETFDIPLKMINGQLVSDTDKLISENKSGLSKAIKIVKYDLGNEKNFINIHNSDPETFEIEIAIDVNNLLRNEANTNS